jgi:chromosome segregation ATPase
MAYFELISGSSNHKNLYVELKNKMIAAEKEAIDVHNRRRLIQKELKLAQRDKSEAKKYDDKRIEFSNAQKQEYLWKIFYNKEKRKEQTIDIELAKTIALEAAENVSEIEKKLAKEKQEYHKMRLEETKVEKNLQAAQDTLDQLQPASIQLNEKVNRGEIQIERTKNEVKLAEKNVKR